MVLTYAAGDSEPAFQVTIYDRNGTELDLTSATAVQFRAKLTTGSTLVTRAGTITTPAIGLCTFTWATTDLATIGIYNMAVRVTWATGRYSSHPNDTYDSLVIIREVQT